MAGKYCIAVFEKSNMVEIVPTGWTFSSDGRRQAYWPSGRVGMTEIVKMVKEDVPVSTLWKAYNIRILKRFGKLL